MTHLVDNELLTNFQYGFREHRSTASAVLQLTDHILSNFDQGKFTIGIFLDLKKLLKPLIIRIY